ISPQSAITLSDSASSDAVNIHIRYRTPEPELQTGGRIDPLTLTDPARFQKQRTIERLITKAQACISPVHGQAWAESCPDADTTGCITLKLPRWQGTLPDRKDI
ncbi:MAG: hypothetical protein JXQ72_12735, partial [Anaerolineae bacterium]|nr:hypothetical protein [Anaerolineae bacterium]